jgi:ketosteroid isomerase-like protein
MHIPTFSAGIACALAMAAAAVAGPAEEQAVRDRDAHWNQVLAAKDLDGILAMYAPDATFMPANAPALQGPGLRAAWSGLVGAPGFKLVLKAEQLTSSKSGDLVIDRGSYVLDITGQPQDRGKYVVVWKKVGGEWKAFHDIFNSDLPIGKPGA